MTDSATDGSGVVGQEGLNAGEHPYNIMDQFIQQALGRIGTIKLVKVMGVKNNGEVSPVGMVDVKAMINLVDGLLGNSQQHDTVFGLPYMRLQGGDNAVIIDPVVGDIGFALICDRDISAAKNNKDFSNPGSYRRFSIADGLYVGGVLNGTPTQYIRFNTDGVRIADKNGGLLEMLSDGLHYNKNLIVTGTVSGSDMIANPGAAQVTLRGHISANSTTPPTPGH